MSDAPGSARASSAAWASACASNSAAACAAALSNLASFSCASSNSRSSCACTSPALRSHSGSCSHSSSWASDSWASGSWWTTPNPPRMLSDGELEADSAGAGKPLDASLWSATRLLLQLIPEPRASGVRRACTANWTPEPRRVLVAAFARLDGTRTDVNAGAGTSMWASAAAGRGATVSGIITVAVASESRRSRSSERIRCSSKSCRSTAAHSQVAFLKHCHAGVGHPRFFVAVSACAGSFRVTVPTHPSRRQWSSAAWKAATAVLYW